VPGPQSTESEPIASPPPGSKTLPGFYKQLTGKRPTQATTLT
jgi:hypothetical protein